LKNILVTGSTGLIGSLVIKHLKKTSNNLFCTYRNKPIKNYKKINWIKTKNFYSKSFNILKFDILLDLAWYDLDNYQSNSHIKSQVSEHFNLYKNLIKKNSKISIYSVGTCLEYGKREGILRENFKPRPIINYAIAKNLLRKKTLNLQNKKQFNFTWLRLFYMYGNNQPERTLYSQFLKTIKKKEKIFKMSKGEQFRDYLTVEKIALLIFKLVLKDSNFGNINLCSGKGVKIKNLVNKWKKKMNPKLKIERGALMMHKHEAYNFYGCNKKLNRILGS